MSARCSLCPSSVVFKAELDQLLAKNEAKPARDRLTLIRLFEVLRSEGYEGGYDAVRRYARSWQRERSSSTSSAFVPLIFEPGEAYQFDWSHEIVVINGVTVTVKVGPCPALPQPYAICPGPIHAKAWRWYSTLMIGRSPSSKAPARAEFTTT